MVLFIVTKPECWQNELRVLVIAVNTLNLRVDYASAKLIFRITWDFFNSSLTLFIHPPGIISLVLVFASHILFVLIASKQIFSQNRA